MRPAVYSLCLCEVRRQWMQVETQLSCNFLSFLAQESNSVLFHARRIGHFHADVTLKVRCVRDCTSEVARSRFNQKHILVHHIVREKKIASFTSGTIRIMSPFVTWRGDSHRKQRKFPWSAKECSMKTRSRSGLYRTAAKINAPKITS